MALIHLLLSMFSAPTHAATVNESESNNTYSTAVCIVLLPAKYPGFSRSSSAEREALDLTVIKDITKTSLDAWVLTQIDADPSQKYLYEIS